MTRDEEKMVEILKDAVVIEAIRYLKSLEAGNPMVESMTAPTTLGLERAVDDYVRLHQDLKKPKSVD